MAFSDRPESRGQRDAASDQSVPPGKHAKTHRSLWMVVVPVVAVVAVLAGLGVYLSRQTSRPLSPPRAAAASTAPSGQGQRALAACRSAWNAQTPALQAADSSLAQWQTHVDAMNALVAGKISLAQASKFWAQTRIGAMRKMRLFERSYGALQRDLPSCTVPAGPGGTAASAATLKACAQGVKVRNQTLFAAERALRTWRGHIGAMEMLRTGKMSPNTATRMWIRMWHRGQRQLDNYHSEASQATAEHC